MYIIFYDYCINTITQNDQTGESEVRTNNEIKEFLY